jgi:hypothetical protein
MDMPAVPSDDRTWLRRFSSRRENLGHSVLRDQLRGASAYDRIAGYFRSSVLEVAGEEIEAVAGTVRVVCNAELNPEDIRAARAAAIVKEWMDVPPEMDGLLNRPRYRRLFDLLRSGKLQVRVLARDSAPFVHGKAGVIRKVDGTAMAFMGSVNETASGWSLNYEIVWEDHSAEGVDWVQAEFDDLWARGDELPDAVITEIGRVAERSEYRDVAEWRAKVEAGEVADAAAAVAVEAPVYRDGERLYPWQKNFVALVQQHRHRHGKARLLLADEVGLGKTMSLGMSALVLALLDPGPVLLLVPATLTMQWQTELWDRLSIPSAVWTQRDCWLDHMGHLIPGRDARDVTRCPYRIGIVSTGLIVQPSAERAALETAKFACVVLDEAHKARRQDLKDRSMSAEGNNLLEFMRVVASRSRHVLLGTATPIQLDPIELWDLVDVLGREAPHVLGDGNSPWKGDPARVLDLLLSRQSLPEDPVERFELIANPLAPSGEPPASLFKAIRTELDLPDDVSSAKGKFRHLTGPSKRRLANGFEEAFWSSNPIVRHVVLRKREMIERVIDPRTGEPYIRRVNVATHPRPDAQGFVDGAILMPLLLRQAYDDAREFCDLVGQRVRGSGFLKTILLRRIGSTVEAGLSTARKLLRGDPAADDGEESDVPATAEEKESIRNLTADERNALTRVIGRLDALTRDQGADPKGGIVADYLRSGWLEHGCIVFSQYYDSAHWLARTLAAVFPQERIGLYGGLGKSMIFQEGTSIKADRELIKGEVAKRGIRLLIATDAACEGLNLQALGTLANLDLPWNPAKLEQRKGRVQRIGQSRSTIDVLNLRYGDSVEGDVFAVLSERFQNIWTMFRQFPDALDDEWTRAILQGRDEARAFLRRLPDQADRFRLRYQSSIDDLDWESCSAVLARQDVIDAMSEGW